ncbi:MAG: hypothetical protein ACRC33_16980, partial [Gemmataceae bacterium]
MKTQWHPAFVALMKLSVGDYYEVEHEFPTGELPRQADLVLIRRERAEPPFDGIWMHLGPWNLFEFKGPTDAADDWDLDLLMHVGTGVAYRLNERRREAGGERFANREFALWYLAPSLGEAFWRRARHRAAWEPEGGGLWRGQVWGHPIFLLDYGQADPRQVDALPLNVLRRDLGTPPGMRDMLLSRLDLLRRFKEFVASYQPDLWEAVRLMAQQKGTIDWEAVGRVEDLRTILPFIPPKHVADEMGEQVVEAMGMENVFETLLKTKTTEELMEFLRQKRPAP